MPSFKSSIVVLFAASHLVVASPVGSNSNQVKNAYSGSGGDASGRSIYPSESYSGTGLFGGIVRKSGLHGLGLNDTVHGSHANSGPAAGSSRSGFTGHPHNGTSPNSIGNSVSGAGGDASGGSVYGGGGLINVFSNNGGNGGQANSGSAGLKNPPAGGRPRLVQRHWTPPIEPHGHGRDPV
ncbi:hypothetical protein M413DRAFT_22917 [Hebeloma cylindrosporum]|uniref:Uncharacterized protein n=1 Tax=Hebeloma cylindrosporum TaxID=76867 RepID=A0A0C3CI47_HEBCY|nr:hypothetical protein M413DRAFT_22917 [Hebeloma cylindrosporum h7]